MEKVMHSVLLYVEKPPYESKQEVFWRPFLEQAAQIARQATGVDILGESCWLMEITVDIPSLIDLAHAAQANELHYRVLFFAEAPLWIPSPGVSA